MTKENKIKNTRAEKLAQVTFLLARACESKEEYFTKMFNLTKAEFRCMRFMDCNCSYSVKDLAQIMDLTSGRITQILTTLEKKNYIKREIDFCDRRNMKISLTEAAEPFIKNVNEKHVELHENVLVHIPENIQDNVLVALDELLKSLTNWSKSNK